MKAYRSWNIHSIRIVALALLSLAAVPATMAQTYTITTLAIFNGTNGAFPQGDLTLRGNTLYGITSDGGVNKKGTVFSVPTTGGTPTILASFNGTDGKYPTAGLILCGSILYGTTEYGGANNFGTVFSVPTTGGIPTVVASFNGMNGEAPTASLTLSGSTLYGTTIRGGVHNHGTVFSVPITGGSPTVIASFNGKNGSQPYANLTLSGSTLYGTTMLGGANSRADNWGTVFSVATTGGTGTADLTYFENFLDFTAETPEPGTFSLMGFALCGFWLLFRFTKPTSSKG